MLPETQSLDVPIFARLSEYAGLWLIEPIAAANLWAMAGRLDLRAHMQIPPEPLKAAVEKIPAGSGGKSIALLRAEGVLMKQKASMGGTSTIQLRRDIRQAVDDDQCAGILLAIDSPGGTVSGTDDLAQEIKAATKSKPVWAHVEDLCASAAYWLASQTQQITANSKTALVGSIGTIQVLTDYSDNYAKEGVKTLVFATGGLKGLGTPGSKITDDQIAHVQGLVNSVQTNFDAAVQKGRGLNAKELAAVRHGGVMTAPQALENKLIDGIQPLGKTLADFSKFLGNNGARAQFASAPRPRLVSLPVIRQGLPMLGRK
jgi:signal peptide peptidase SppA